MPKRFLKANSFNQRRLKRKWAKIPKPGIVDAKLVDEDIIYYKDGFWGVLERYNQNIVVYNTKDNKGALYYVADFLIFLKNKCNIKYCQCKGRIGKYDFFHKYYGDDFIKAGVRGGENVYYICISDNAIKVSREIKCRIDATRQRNLRAHKNSGKAPKIKNIGI